MLISAVAALVLFAAPDAAQSGDTAAPADKPAAEAAAKPKKTCYKTLPPGSKLPKTVCVTEKAPKQEADKAGKADAPAA